MSRARWVRYAALAAWIAYFVVPTDAGGLVHGLPLGPIECAALLALAWLASRATVPRHGWIAVVVLIVFATSASLIPGTGGFRARYFANAGATGEPERSTEFNEQGFTRIDRRLDFALGANEFPLAFFNDIARFNFQNPAGPRRRQLEFSATWTGQLWAAPGARTLYIDAPDSSAQLFVDGVRALSVTPATDTAEVTLPLSQGWHRLDLTFSSPYGAPRQFSAGELTTAGRRAFSDADVSTQRVRPWQVTALRVLRLAKTASDGMVLGWLAWSFAVSFWLLLRGVALETRAWRQRSRVAPLLAVAAGVEALVHAWPWSRQFMVMRGGDDPMTYEWYSRDILLNGLLMNGGAPAGQGEPFYYQALYPYFLAAVHAVSGEGMFGVLLMQRMLVAFAVWMMVRIAVEIAGDQVWPGALAAGSVFAVGKYWPIAADLLNESLYVPLLVAWAALAVRLYQAPSIARAVGTGVVGAVAAMTRSTALLAWPLVFGACWRAWRDGSRRRAWLGALVLSSVAVFSLIGARNWIVANQLALTSSEFGVTLLGGNEPPPDLVMDPGRSARYARLGLSEPTARVVEYAIAAPGEFLLHQGRKTLFALGVYEPYAPGWGYSPIYIVGWLLAACGIVCAVRAGLVPPMAAALPALIAASQFVAVVGVYPKSERLILPIYALLVPYAGIAIARAATTVWPRKG